MPSICSRNFRVIIFVGSKLPYLCIVLASRLNRKALQWFDLCWNIMSVIVQTFEIKWKVLNKIFQNKAYKCFLIFFFFFFFFFAEIGKACFVFWYEKFMISVDENLFHNRYLVSLIKLQHLHTWWRLVTIILANIFWEPLVQRIYAQQALLFCGTFLTQFRK